MPKRINKPSRRRDVYLDDDNWEKLLILAEISRGSPSQSSLIREAIDEYLQPHEAEIAKEKKRRKKLSIKKVLDIKK